MNTWTLAYTLDNPSLGIEVGCKIEITNPKGVPAILDKFIKEGSLLEFHLTLNMDEDEDEDEECWYDQEEYEND